MFRSIFIIFSMSIALQAGANLNALQSEFGPVFNDLKERTSQNVINVGYLKYLATHRFTEPGLCRSIGLKKCKKYMNISNGVKGFLESLPCPNNCARRCDNLFCHLEATEKDRHMREIDISYGHSTSSIDQTWERPFTISGPERVYREAMLNTCIEYMKAFMVAYKSHLRRSQPDSWTELYAKALRTWKVVYLYSSRMFDKVCPQGPSEEGYAPHPLHPRPFIHTAFLVPRDGIWYLVNAEVYQGQNEIEIVEVGPSYEGLEHSIFRLPNLDQKWGPSKGDFRWRAVTDVDRFINGFDGQETVNIAVSGNKSQHLCR